MLRGWREEDRGAFATMNGDPETMRYFVAPLSRPESDVLFDTWSSTFAAHGYGMWVVARRDDPDHMLGSVGLLPVGPVFPFSPAVETGWRFRRRAWGNGYATESARAALAFGFVEVGVPEIVAFTAVANRPSQAVMARLGMAHDPADDFVHPKMADGHPLGPHVLYRAAGHEWRAGPAGR